MILAFHQGEVAGIATISTFIAALIGIPVSAAIVRDRRHAQAYI
jgi:ABC-type spermidine/putrescine transport system permease subunit II